MDVQMQVHLPPQLRRRTSRQEHPEQSPQQDVHPPYLRSVKPKQAQQGGLQQLPQPPLRICLAAPRQPAQALVSHQPQTLQLSPRRPHQPWLQRPRAPQHRSLRCRLVKGRRPRLPRRARPGPARAPRTALARAPLPRPAPSPHNRRWCDLATYRKECKFVKSCM